MSRERERERRVIGCTVIAIWRYECKRVFAGYELRAWYIGELA